jgi:hypothetical protein
MVKIKGWLIFDLVGDSIVKFATHNVVKEASLFFVTMPKGEWYSKYSLYFVPNLDNLRSLGAWQCDKCEKSFSSYKKLKSHERDVHSY